MPTLAREKFNLGHYRKTVMSGIGGFERYRDVTTANLRMTIVFVLILK